MLWFFSPLISCHVIVSKLANLSSNHPRLFTSKCLHPKSPLKSIIEKRHTGLRVSGDGLGPIPLRGCFWSCGATLCLGFFRLITQPQPGVSYNIQPLTHGLSHDRLAQNPTILFALPSTAAPHGLSRSAIEKICPHSNLTPLALFLFAVHPTHLDCHPMSLRRTIRDACHRFPL